MDLRKHIKNNKITIIVKPNAKKTEILGYNENKKAVRIAIKAVPDKGKANTALVKFVSKELGCRVAIVSGARSREKIIERK
jgi:uncharacterized protein